MTAALYALRAGKSVLVIEKNSFGGQITWSPKVENFPTIVSISGTELADRLLEQVLAQGADTELDEVCELRRNENGFDIKTEFGGSFKARAVIIATGAKPRMLGVTREEELVGAGVCFCAVCDGAFYKGKAVGVCGGGNSALQDAMLLSDTASCVYLIHRRGDFRGEAKLVEALREKENVEFVLESRITKLHGDDELCGVTVENSAGESRDIELEGLFVAVGHAPDNSLFSELIELDSAGYAASGEDCVTKTPGLFVAGDCRRKQVRQLTTAAADGSAAALAACRYIDSL